MASKEKTKAEHQGKQELVKNNKHNYKLSEEDKINIVLEHTLNRTKQKASELCSKYGISERTLYDLVNNKKYKNEVNKYITETSKNFSKKAAIIIDKTLNRINQRLDEDISNNTLAQLATTLGVLYDKSRLESNLSTNNTAIEVKVTVER